MPKNKYHLLFKSSEISVFQTMFSKHKTVLSVLVWSVSNRLKCHEQNIQSTPYRRSSLTQRLLWLTSLFSWRKQEEFYLQCRHLKLTTKNVVFCSLLGCDWSGAGRGASQAGGSDTQVSYTQCYWDIGIKSTGLHKECNSKINSY